MINNYKISIIMPVYNASMYLWRSIESVLLQTFRNFELICVDDGSTDNSLEILDDYASKDGRIKVISKKNGGQTSARREGLKEAKGIYVGFIDDDDYVDADMFEVMLSFAEVNKLDFVSSGYYLEGNYTTMCLDEVEAELYDSTTIQNLREKVFYNMNKKVSGVKGTLWNKLYKRELLLNAIKHMPDNLTIAEDKALIVSYLLYCNNAGIIKTPFYHWCINKGSFSRAERPNYLTDVQNTYNYFKSLYTHPLFTYEMRKQCEVYIIKLLLNGVNWNLGFTFDNLLRIDPVWMDEIPQNANIMIYGGGELANQYKHQLKNLRNDVFIRRDCGFDKPSIEDYEGCDAVVIAIKNENKVKEIKNYLLNIGIPEKDILWTPQPEFFWKYVEAEGLME